MSIDTNSILSKTPKGVEEIATRVHKIPSRLRTALVMVDGQKSVAEILNSAGPLAEQLQIHLLELEKTGFIVDRVLQASAASAAQAMFPRPSTPTNAPQPIAPQGQPLAKNPIPSVELKPLGDNSGSYQRGQVEKVKAANEPILSAEATPETPPVAKPAEMPEIKPSGDMRDLLFGKR